MCTKISWDRGEYHAVGRGWIDVCCFWFQFVLRFPSLCALSS